MQVRLNRVVPDNCHLLVTTLLGVDTVHIGACESGELVDHDDVLAGVGALLDDSWNRIVECGDAARLGGQRNDLATTTRASGAVATMWSMSVPKRSASCRADARAGRSTRARASAIRWLATGANSSTRAARREPCRRVALVAPVSDSDVDNPSQSSTTRACDSRSFLQPPFRPRWGSRRRIPRTSWTLVSENRRRGRARNRPPPHQRRAWRRRKHR